jgi:hypothetical protein
MLIKRKDMSRKGVISPDDLESVDMSKSPGFEKWLPKYDEDDFFGLDRTAPLIRVNKKLPLLKRLWRRLNHLFLTLLIR